MTLGEKIRKLRQDARLSQAQLADALVVSRAAVAKWENDNGIPDVVNLKALADYFHCDLDSLLDEAKELSVINGNTVVVNPESFCGKSCADCTYKGILDCSGCKTGAAERENSDCEIAKCCTNHVQESCDDCSLNVQCRMLRGADSKPRQRESVVHRERFLRDLFQQRAPIFGKWLWILFWLIVPANLADFMTLELFARLPIFLEIGRIGTASCMLLYGLILLHLGRQCDRFKTAGICCMIKFGIPLLSWFINTPQFSFLLAIPTVIVTLVETYYEHIGYSEVLLHFHDDLSQKWEMLWKANLVLWCCVFCSILLLMEFRILGTLALVLSVIALIVVSILKFVYLYQTARFFREAM